MTYHWNLDHSNGVKTSLLIILYYFIGMPLFVARFFLMIILMLAIQCRVLGGCLRVCVRDMFHMGVRYLLEMVGKFDFWGKFGLVC